MTDHNETERTDWQKHVAAQCNNLAWGLVETAELTPDDQIKLLTLAATARHHWHGIGTENQIAHADLLFAWALARLGAADHALRLATETTTYFDAGGADWERACAHAALAAAYFAKGDAQALHQQLAHAQALGAELDEPDAGYFRAAFSTIPTPD